jgi:hypothetical protein
MFSVQKIISLCLIFYLIGVVWFLLFPAVCITTGEMKPRGMFVDEHALLTTSIPFEKVDYISSRDESNNITHMETLIKYDGYDVETATYDGMNIMSVLVEPRSRPSSMEVSIIVIKICKTDQYPKWILDVIISIVRHLRACKWMSKSVLILLLPEISDMQSPVLQRWLDDYHTSREVPFKAHTFYGLIRDALVLDLFPCSMAITGETVMPSPDEWSDGYEMAVIGKYGQLPNMDFLSSILSMQSPHLSLKHDRIMKALVAKYIPGALALLTSGTDSYISTGSTYRDRLFGLIAFCTGSIMGTDGFHGHFLSHNIDSMTIRPMLPKSYSYSERSGPGRRSESRGRRRPPTTMSHFLSTVISVVRVNSNLHGKDISFAMRCKHLGLGTNM